MIDTLIGLGLDHADDAMRAYRKRYTDVGWLENSVFPEYPRVVDDLATQGRTMTMATSKNENTARAILEHFSLAVRLRLAAQQGRRDRVGPETIGHHTRPGHRASRPSRRDDRRSAPDDASDGAESLRKVPTSFFVWWGYARAGRDAASWRVDSVVDLREVLGV